MGYKSPGQKAPSTRRCIKTVTGWYSQDGAPWVRKHPAPQGALRLAHVESCSDLLLGKKHPAPEGALRQIRPMACHPPPRSVVRKPPAPQGALRQRTDHRRAHGLVRKHPAPEGALRRSQNGGRNGLCCCQKAPSTRRCIKTIPNPTRAR